MSTEKGRVATKPLIIRNLVKTTLDNNDYDVKNTVDVSGSTRSDKHSQINVSMGNIVNLTDITEEFSQLLFQFLVRIETPHRKAELLEEVSFNVASDVIEDILTLGRSDPADSEGLTGWLESILLVDIQPVGLVTSKSKTHIIIVEFNAQYFNKYKL